MIVPNGGQAINEVVKYSNGCKKDQGIYKGQRLVRIGSRMNMGRTDEVAFVPLDRIG